LCLAELREDDGLARRHREVLVEWGTRCDLDGIGSWSLDDFWHEVQGHGYSITAPTRRFLEAWVDRMRATDAGVGDDAEGRRLVQEREQRLKGPRSRFKNRGALTQWGGSSGVGRLVYRWPTARRFLDDLLPPLGRT
jgi:hypothetical protein